MRGSGFQGGARALVLPAVAAFLTLAPLARAACRVVDVPRLPLHAGGRSPAERQPDAFGHAAILWLGDEQSSLEGDRVRARRNYSEARVSFDAAGLYVVVSVHDFYQYDNQIVALRGS